MRVDSGIGLEIDADRKTDVISEYSFGKSTCSLDTPDLGEPMRKLLEAGVQIHPVARAFPTLVLGMTKITGWLAPFFPFMNAQKGFKGIEKELIRPPYEKALQGDVQDDETSIVQALATNKSLSADEKTFSRVAGEALNLIGAGTETTGRTVSDSKPQRDDDTNTLLCSSQSRSSTSLIILKSSRASSPSFAPSCHPPHPLFLR